MLENLGKPHGAYNPPNPNPYFLIEESHKRQRIRASPNYTSSKK